jgi:hypothetical protein
MAPYERLRRAEAVARERYPDANRVHALWTPQSPVSDVMVEVWTGEPRRESARTFVPTAAELVAS